MEIVLPVTGQDMDVSKNRGTPKWMVKIMENPIKMGWFGGVNTPIFGTTHMIDTHMIDVSFHFLGCSGFALFTWKLKE